MRRWIKGRRKNRWGERGGGGGKQGHEGWSEGLGQGAPFQPSHRSLSITYSQGKNCAENRPEAGSVVHTSVALWCQTFLVTYSIPEALGKWILMLLRARVLKMKLVEIHFPITKDLHGKKKTKCKIFSKFFSCSHCMPVTWHALLKTPCWVIVDISLSISQAELRKRKIPLKEMEMKLFIVRYFQPDWKSTLTFALTVLLLLTFFCSSFSSYNKGPLTNPTMLAN